jgi:hypothetical protein
MTEPRVLVPCKVTLFWRRYGDGIEWRADFVPFPVPIARQGVHDINGWQSAPSRDGSPDPLYTAAFLVGVRLASYGGHALEFKIVEEPSQREPPLTGGFDETNGSFNEDGLTIEFGGACPVQGFGTLDGRFVYYRARGDGWSFEVWAEGVDVADDGLPEPSPEWALDRHGTYAWPEGGYLHRDQSILNLREALAAWRSRGAT